MEEESLKRMAEQCDSDAEFGAKVRKRLCGGHWAQRELRGWNPSLSAPAGMRGGPLGRPRPQPS
eukprot:7333066-Alexandrium_andersonii.AAC.1